MSFNSGLIKINLSIVFFTIILNSLSALGASKNEEVGKDSTMFLGIENFNFFKNSEYFNPIVEGYTDPGLFLTTKFIWKISEKINMSGGLHFLKYSGEKGFKNFQPLLQIGYYPNGHFQVIMGSLIKKKYIPLPDYLYHSDLFWERNIENGLQLRYFKNSFKGDLWVDWENHINNNSTEQEEFILGFAGTYFIPREINGLSVNFPLSVLINHRGGQVNSSEKDLVTLTNSMAGINLTWKSASLANKLSFDYNIAGFLDMSQSKNQFYSKGFGHYSKLSFLTKNIILFSEYWQAYHYMSSRGNPIYMCVSTRNEDYTRPERKLWVNGIKMMHHIKYNSNFSIEFNSYYDFQRLDFDYSVLFSIYINLIKPLL